MSQKMYCPVNGLSWRSMKEVIAHPVSEPEIIGYYSMDGDRNYLADSSGMNYYNPPELGNVYMDLNQGIESAVVVSHCSAGGSIDDLLQWVTRNSNKILASETDKWIEPRFVTSGGVLTRILYSRFERDAAWIISAAKLKGTIYLSRFRSPHELEVEKNMPSYYSSWGYKFEQYIVSDHPDKRPDTFRPVIEPAEFRCMFRRRFGNHDVLYSSEMDAVCSKKVLTDPLPLKELKFIELKTKKILSHSGQMKNFHRNTTIQWWAQNYVVGINDVLCGFRDEHGIVRNLELFSLDQLIDMGKMYWNPVSCINYCHDFLSFVDRTVVEDFDKAIYKFVKVPYHQVTVTQEEPTSAYAFLPSSFIAKTG